MKSIFTMAWRNLGRHRGRTLLSFLAVMLGVLIVILFKGFIDGMVDSSVNNNINLNSGHVRIIRPEYEVKEKLRSLAYPVGETGKSAPDLIREIGRLPGVKMAAGRIRFGMMLVVGDINETVIGIGAVPETEEKINHLSGYLTGLGSGRLPTAGKREILLGRDLLQKLHLKVGDKVNALFSTSMASFKVATFIIVGKMASGLKMLDESAAYIPLDQAMSLLELPDMVTEIVVFGKDADSVKPLTATVHNYLKAGKENLKVIPWNQFNEVIGTLEKARSIYNLIYIFMLVLASFVVFNTLMMVVAERTREIGVFSAMGMTPLEIRQLFIYEGLMIAVMGSLTGTLIGGGLNFLLSRIGIDMSRGLGTLSADFTILPKIFPSYNLTILLSSFLLGVCVTMLAAYLPARRAALMKPTEALRTI